MKAIYLFNMKKLIYILLTLIILAAGCSREKSSPSTADSAKAATTEQVLHDSQITLYQDGRTTAVIEAKYIEKRFGQQNTMARDIIAHFYDSTGTMTSWLVADSGEVEENSNRMTVWGNIEATSKDSVKLYTESLNWDQKINKVVTEDYVEIHREDVIMRGYGMETDRTLKNFVIKHNVSGKLDQLPVQEK